MEKRQITVVNPKNNLKRTIETDVETLGELKSLLSRESVNFDGLTMQEGYSGQALSGDDDSMLPRNSVFRGKRTNNLVIMLTDPDTRIKNG